MQYMIKVEDPCTESWEKMIPEGNGRHCMSCCKTVVDFTNWEPADIIQYLKEKGEGNVCGHFKKQQLNVPVETPETLAIKVWNAPVPLYRKIAAVIIVLFGVSIASCNTNGKSSNIANRIDTIPSNTPADTTYLKMLGKPSVPQVPTDTPFKHVFTPPHIPHERLQGDVMFTEVPANITDSINREPLIQGKYKIEVLDTPGKHQAGGISNNNMPSVDTAR